MAIPIIMPKQGQTVKLYPDCLAQAGGRAGFEGDLLFSYETDKAVFDEESTAEEFSLRSSLKRVTRYRY